MMYRPTPPNIVRNLLFVGAASALLAMLAFAYLSAGIVIAVLAG